MEVIDRASSAARTQPGLSAKLRQRIANEFQSRWENEWGAKFVTHGVPPGPNAVRLDGNDYLAVTGHPQVVQAQLDALRRGQEFIIQSGVFQLDGNPASHLQRSLASWLGKEDGLLCQSGYTANLGLLQVIADPQTPVYLDGLAHMSLWEGARAAGAPSHGFRHNDPEHLSKMATRHGPGLVVVDSVYSTTGAVARLAELVEVAEQHDCMMVVDESHSLGTHGPGGAGLCAMLGLTDRVHFITASLAKAFAGRAGFFTMPAELRPYLMCHSYPSIFSSCLLPHRSPALPPRSTSSSAVTRRANSFTRTPVGCEPRSSKRAIRSTKGPSRSSHWRRVRKATPWHCAMRWSRGACSAPCSARRRRAAIARWCA